MANFNIVMEQSIKETFGMTCAVEVGESTIPAVTTTMETGRMTEELAEAHPNLEKKSMRVNG